MANYTTADKVKAQTIMAQKFNSGELRYRFPATFMEFKKGGEIMFPSHKVERTREDRPVEVNYFARSARALGTAGRIHNHTGVKGDSAVITPSWQPYDDTFKMSLKQADNSVYTDVEQLANEYGNVIANFAEGLESAAASYVFANRSGVNVRAASATEGTFNATQDAFEIPEATENRAVQIAKVTMDINKYQGLPYVFFCDSIAYSKFEYMANQGSGNSSNLSFQYSNIMFVHSAGLDALAAGLASPYTKGFWVAAPEGYVAALDWIPKQNRMGIETKENSYSTIINPIDGLSYAQHSYEARADETGDNGYAQDVVTQFEVSIDIALEHAPLTTAGETPLQAMAIV